MIYGLIRGADHKAAAGLKTDFLQGLQTGKAVCQGQFSWMKPAVML